MLNIVKIIILIINHRSIQQSRNMPEAFDTLYKVIKSTNFGINVLYQDTQIQTVASYSIKQSANFPLLFSVLSFSNILYVYFGSVSKGVDTSVLGLSREEALNKPYIASMGIYVFRKDVLLKLLRYVLLNLHLPHFLCQGLVVWYIGI